MLQHEDFYEVDDVFREKDYRKYILSMFEYYWKNMTLGKLHYILTEVLYTNDLAQVVQAMEEA